MAAERPPKSGRPFSYGNSSYERAATHAAKARVSGTATIASLSSSLCFLFLRAFLRLSINPALQGGSRCDEVVSPGPLKCGRLVLPFGPCRNAECSGRLKYGAFGSSD